MKYILYCRKSTDTEDKQVLSLDSQERELLDIAKNQNLEVIQVMKESMSAKSPDRPIFNAMMKMIDSGKADAILCWKIDRLTRNPVDGGQIQWLLQNNKIKCIRTFEKNYFPSDNVLLMSIEQAMANQYIRDLSTNVKRGNREKLARGEWPNHAPFGYLNDKNTKSITIDPVRSKYLIRSFELYATGAYGFKDIARILHDEGLRTCSGKKVYQGHINRFIDNPFYCGLMLRDGKYYAGKHQPLISKALFDQAQDVLHNRNRPRPQKQFFTLRGFLKCENCGCALTASLKKGHQYYYCTNSKGACDEHKSYLRENTLYSIVADLFGTLDFTEKKIELMYKASKEMSQVKDAYAESALTTLETELNALTAKESRLLDTFLDGQITKDIYNAKALEIHNERVSLNQRIGETKANGMRGVLTLEPVKEIFLRASRAKKEFLAKDDFGKREIVSKILWNLSMKNQSVAKVSFKSPYDILAKAPKTGDIKTLLRDLDSNQDDSFQRAASYH
jgi:site-specific DNA recombinase